MSSAPPPGWYRDPSYPLTERWWDGAAWTDHRRQPDAPVAPVAPADGRERRRVGAIALTTAGAVLVAAVVTGVVVLGHDGDGAAQAESSAAAPTSAPASDESPTAAAPSATGDPNVVLDDLNGITFPVPKGWARAENVAEDDVVLTTPGVYDCPGDPGFCRRGRVLSRTATSVPGASPESIAKGDIADAAHEEYDRDPIGNRPYGGVTSHRLLGSGQVAVAGRVLRTLARQHGEGARRLCRVPGVPLQRGLADAGRRPLRLRRGPGRSAAVRHGQDHQGDQTGGRRGGEWRGGQQHRSTLTPGRPQRKVCPSPR
ncbi:uncharacterized protein DUF2510 [Streptomyces sp. 3212.3]|nr:uncharacterized protein DUF2510 [Streptomyces sp. 3212.3]